jgi:hypothetical protein
MAEVENVVVRVAGQGFEKLSAKMATLGAQSKALEKRVNRTSKGFTQLSGSMSASTKQLRQNAAATTNLGQKQQVLQQYMSKGTRGFSQFAKVARVLMFAVIGLGIEFAVTAGSLMLVNAAFTIGNAIMKAYKWSMGGVAAAAAAVGAALAIAAAAQREYTAAQFAHTQKATPLFGSAMNHSMAQLRNLTNDTELAVFGVENLNAAFAAVSKNSQFTGKSQQVIRALRDFAAIGGDPGKNLAGIGEFVGLLQKEGKVTAKVSAAAKAIGPEFEKAFKKIKKSGGGVNEIFSSILSGDMSKAGGVTGAADAVEGTLVGLFKKYKTLLVGLFGDIGTPLLAPAKKALAEIFNIVRNGIQRIAPGITKFGEGSFLPTIVKAVEKITDFTVKLFDKYLPQSEGMLGQIKGWWLQFKSIFQSTKDTLNELREGGSIVIDMFGIPLKELFKGIGENVKAFAQLAVENKDDFIGFGEGLGKVVDQLMLFAQKFKEAFVAALPTINQILDVVSKIISAVTKVVELIARIPFGGEMLMGIAGYGAFKGRRSAQRAARMGGGKAQNKYQHMGNAAMSMMGLPMYAGQGLYDFDPTTGQAMLDANGNPISAGRRNVDATRTRISGGRLGGRIFRGGRNSKLLSAASFVGSQFNPSESRRIAKAEWDFHNQNIYDDQKVNRVAAGTPGAVYDQNLGSYVTKGGYVANPNQLTGRKAKIARAKAGFKGGFGMGGMVGGMAISALTNSGMAPSFMKENAGAINMGAGLMAVNPMLGLGAMGAGTLVNLAKGTGARTAGGGALTGMASGAALGAAVGSFVPVIGTAVGALVGTVVGGIVGFFGGKKAEKNVAKEAAKSVSAKSLGDVVSKFITGDTTGAKGVAGAMLTRASRFKSMSASEQDSYITDLERKGTITNTQAQRARQHKGTFGDELQTIATDTDVVTKSLSGSFENLMNGLQGSTGKSRKEIMELAQSMGVNLYEPTLKLTDAISGLGQQMDLTVEGLAASGTDALLRANRVFDDMFETEKLTSAMNAAGQGIASAGTGSRDDYIGLLQKTSEYLANTNPEDPLSQMYTLQGMYGEGGTQFQAGGHLANVGRADFIANAGPQYDQLINAQASNLAQNRTQALTQLMNQGGFEFTKGAEGFAGIQSQLETMYKSTDPAVQANARKIEAFLQSGSGLGSNSQEISANLIGMGVDISALGGLKESTAGTITDQLTTQQEKLKTDIVAAIGTGFDQAPKWWNEKPTWWDPKDTSSPRASAVGDTVSSRLGRTMSRHNYFDSTMTGKRTVTSAWRNYGLGSPSSDHVTGNAYDLTGQNLGQYATTINKAGGFAEFHGGGGSRHLHVVPPSSPVGDSGTSRIGQVAPTANQQPSGGAVTINVYASEGQSEQEIARVVMNEISKAQRNWRERR